MHPYDETRHPSAPLLGIGPSDERRAAFERWMDEQGRALFDHWLKARVSAWADNVFSSQEYQYILHGLCLARYFKGVRQKEKQGHDLTKEERLIARRCRAVQHRGQDLLVKGYLGGRFTAEELSDLRRFAMWLEVRCCGGGLLPVDLDLTKTRAWLKRGDLRPLPGTLARDFKLLRMEAVLQSAAYSDRNPHDPADVLRPTVVREILQVMKGYTPAPPDPAHPMAIVKPKTDPSEEGKASDAVRLSYFRGRRPVLLILWEQAGARAMPFDDTRGRLEVTRAWARTSATEAIYRVRVDRSVDLWLNGDAVPFAELRPGDRLGIQFCCVDEPNDILPALRIRAYRWHLPVESRGALR
jgi:hypothetical protein